jgi:hypothetical protein
VSAALESLRLLRPIDPRRDHTRGGKARSGTVEVALYGDFLCPIGDPLSLLLAEQAFPASPYAVAIS